MRIIDADFLIDCIKSQLGTGGVLFDEVMKKFIGILEATPTIDAVSVVRCKDCKYYRADDYSGVYHCFFNSNAVTDDDFCSYGER